MTQDELMVLELGQIPARPIVEAVARYVRENGQELPVGKYDLTFVGFVAERADVPHYTLVTWIEDPDRVQSMPFDVADRLLCASEQWHLWYGELHEYYELVDLTWKQCECEGCETWFQIKTDTIGRPKHNKYCSRACNQAAYKLRIGRTQQRLPRSSRRKKGGRPKGSREAFCRHGHVRTPENTIVLGNGKQRCRECNRESSARAYATRRLRERAA